MSLLTIEDIQEIIDAGRPDWIKLAEKKWTTLNVHINGIGTAEYLDRVTHYENTRQFQLRRDFATSNKFVFENLLRPVDKIFSAKGGNRVYEASTNEKEKLLKDKLSNISEGYSITTWIQKIQANKFYTDPNGLVYFEVSELGVDTYPTIKTIPSIFNYQADGRKLDWLIFQPEKRTDESGTELEGDFYRVVDDAFDYIIHVIDKKATIVKDDTYPNIYGKVPAIINSDIIAPDLKMKDSPVDAVIENADHYLNTNSVKNIYEFLHGYPIFWAVVPECKVCDGTGLYKGNDCPTCDGSGHRMNKDVSDVIKIKPPKDKEDPKIAPDIAGYVQPDLETWREQRSELDWVWSLMHFTLWGTHRQEKANNETATAAFLDVQPVNDRLNQFTDSFEGMEQMMTDLIGQFYLREAYKGSSINYGRRYLVESPDQIWSKYETAREKGTTKISLDYLLSQFFQAEFANDLKNLTVSQKGMKLEPFIHKTDEEIDSLPVLDEDKQRKYYFNEWFKTLEFNDILVKDVNTLNKEFETFINAKKR